MKLLRSHHSDDNSKTHATPGWLSQESLQELMDLFPIGQSIQHFPEYHNEEIENTVILAYCINKEFIYSMADIQLDDEQLIIEGDVNKPITLSDIDNFYLIVPFVEHSQLDYVRNKSHLVDTPINNYSLGNSITLLSTSTELRCEPQLDTTVVRQMVLKGGIYANNKVVALEPIIDGLEHVDRRVFQRVETDIEIDIAPIKSPDFMPAQLMDYCEKTARIAFQEGSFLSKMNATESIQLLFQSYKSTQKFLLAAEIQKIEKTDAVVSFTGIKKGRRFVDLENVDLLAIKASLLQHPKTRPLH